MNTRPGRDAVLTLLATLLAFSGVAALPARSGAQEGLTGPVEYCSQAGGVMRARYPAYDTNGADALRLAGERRFCEFTASDGSRISVALDTLNAEAPTLAALAYRDPPKPTPAPPSVNPSSVYCSQLGGTDQFGGVNAAGGGWVLADLPAPPPAGGPAAGEPDEVLAMCVFPDLSSIDSWGLTYHAAGIVRGADLDPLFRYQPDEARRR